MPGLGSADLDLSPLHQLDVLLRSRKKAMPSVLQSQVDVVLDGLLVVRATDDDNFVAAAVPQLRPAIADVAELLTRLGHAAANEQQNLEICLHDALGGLVAVLRTVLATRFGGGDDKEVNPVSLQLFKSYLEEAERMRSNRRTAAICASALLVAAVLSAVWAASVAAAKPQEFGARSVATLLVALGSATAAAATLRHRRSEATNMQSARAWLGHDDALAGLSGNARDAAVVALLPRLFARPIEDPDPLRDLPPVMLPARQADPGQTS